MRDSYSVSSGLLLAAAMAMAAACPRPASADAVTTSPGPAPAAGLSAAGKLGVPLGGRPEPLVGTPGPARPGGGHATTADWGGQAASRAASEVVGEPRAGRVSATPWGTAEWAAQGVAAALLYGLSRRGRRRRRRARW